MLVPVVWSTLLLLTTRICQANQQSQLTKFLQPNNVEDRNEFATDAINCTRECVRGDHRICYYQFHVENYVTLNEACMDCVANGSSCDLPQCVTADGYKRGILVVNRRLPGPSIQVCEGDRIVVDVINKMSGRSTSIHWHGIFQKGTPFYDGTPMVTQCPIFERDAFRYNFIVKQPGTFFWHSHDGIQKVDGLQGSLIVRRPKEEDPNGNLYDEDLPAHVMVIMDWFHSCSDDHFPGIVDPDPLKYQTYFLINGRGRYKDPENGTISNTPYTVYHVTPGKRYRFRVVGATCDHCYVRLSIEGHRLTLIGTDGNAVKPVVVDYVEISSGERYDFVINATQEVKSYWIEVRAQGIQCAATNNYQLAVLKYEGSNEMEPSTVVQDGTDFNSDGVELNPVNSTCTGNGICVAQLEAIENFNEVVMNSEPDVTFTMNIGYYFPTVEELYQNNTYDSYIHPADAIDFSPWVNNISHVEGPSPLLSQRDDIPPEAFCPLDNDGFPYCDKDNCHCIQIVKVPQDALVQVILIDRSIGGGINHPFHLHGFAFNVMAMGYLEDVQYSTEAIEEQMKARNIIKSSAPALKDTVTVPSSGYTVIRFIADNPGCWLFHCHFIFHHVAGMALVLQVGDSEELPPVPANFPNCGNFLPSVDIDEFDVC